MTPTTLIGWGLLCIVQNAAFTMVSRARNSGSDLYHGVAAVFSNGIWFAAIFFTIDFVNAVNTVWQGFGIGAIYVACTVFGSVVAGNLLRRFIEKGERRVGFYKDDA